MLLHWSFSFLNFDIINIDHLMWNLELWDRWLSFLFVTWKKELNSDILLCVLALQLIKSEREYFAEDKQFHLHVLLLLKKKV